MGKIIKLFLLLLASIGRSIDVQAYNQGHQLMSHNHSPNPWRDYAPYNNFIGAQASPNMNLMVVKGYANEDHGEIGRTMTESMNYGNYAPAFSYGREREQSSGGNFNDIQSPSPQNTMDETLVPPEHYYPHHNFDASSSSNYLGHSNVVYEPKLLNHEIQSSVSAIDGSPVLRALFSLHNVPIPPPLIMLTNFGDGSYRYLNDFDELRQPPQNMRRTAISRMSDDDDGSLSRSMESTFERNAASFNDFMQQSFQQSFFRNLFPSFNQRSSPPPSFFPQTNFHRPSAFPSPPPIFAPSLFPERSFSLEPMPKFNFARPNNDVDDNHRGYDYTPPSLIQIGNQNTNTRSNTGNSMQRGIVQISDDEDGMMFDDEMDTTTTIDSSTATEDYETTTMFGEDDRVDLNVIKTLAG